MNHLKLVPGLNFPSNPEENQTKLLDVLQKIGTEGRNGQDKGDQAESSKDGGDAGTEGEGHCV
jgi:hypothetical protein